jgi:P-type Ca2+ transporter type 2C
VLISGHNIRCDEASITGESDQKKKIPGGKAIAQLAMGGNVEKIDPFIISGSKVLEGTGSYLVTGVGMNSSYGKLIMAVTDDSESTATPLQIKLGIMAEQITKVGCAVALFLFLVLFTKFLYQLPTNPDTAVEKVQDFFQLVIVTIAIIVIAVPEGLPLAVTLALAFAMTRMLKDQNLVRVLSSCETMGNATAICSDKTGTLTMNKMTVVGGLLGARCSFRTQQEAAYRDESSGDETDSDSTAPVPSSGLASILSPKFKDLLLQSIAINSTAFEGDDDQDFIGSKTETALLLFAKAYLGMGSVSEERANANVVEVFPFDSARKCMATVVRLTNGTYRMYVKGASEILLDSCTQIIADPSGPLTVTALTKDCSETLISTINKHGSKSLRTIAVVYRDFDSWPPCQARTVEDDPEQADFEDIFKEMVFFGVVGIQDPLRPDVKMAVERCQHAGVFVRMVTGDNKGTAEAIAKECGIFTEGGIVLEGPEFRKLPQPQMDRILPKLQVLARSSPEDKRILVKRLKELGDIVAVTGDGTNDGPALRAADVSFSMGIAGTEVAKEASSIILMDDNFSSIIKALEWGRAVNDSVKKFLQVCLPLSRYFVFANAICSLVPTHCQYHGGRNYIRVCDREPQRRTNPHTGSITLGQPYHGHICCTCPCNRPAVSKHSGQKTRPEIKPDLVEHVEDDYWTGDIPVDCDPNLELCG